MERKKSFASDVLVLISAPVISQIVGLFLMPIITRLYAPEDFGLMNLLTSIVMFFTVFSTMGYHNAIILPKSNFTARSILHICFLFTFIISFLVFIFFYKAKEEIATFFNTPDLINYLWLAPIIIFFNGIYETLRFWNSRLRHFNKISISRVYRVIAQITYRITAGLLGYATAGSLIFSNLFADLTKNIFVINNTTLKVSKEKKILYSNLATIAKRYIKFPKYSVLGGVLTKAPNIIIPYFIVLYFGQENLGYYSLCYMVITLPISFFISSISEALMPRIAMAKHENKHQGMIIKVYERIFSFTVFPFLILGIFGDIIFSFLFGQEWVTAGVFMQILVFGTFSTIVFSSMTYPILISMERQEIIPINKLIHIINVAISYIIGGYYNNIFMALALFSMLQSLQASIIGIFVLHIVEIHFFQLAKKLIYYFFLCLLFTGFFLFIKYWISFSIIFLFITIVACSLLYYFLVLNYDVEIKDMLVDALKKQ